MINYRSAVLAIGAPADRERLPGAAQHALFPCDVEEALALKEQFLALRQGHVSVIIAGEWPGPGLEYAGWLATAAQEHGLAGLQIHRVISLPRSVALCAKTSRTRCAERKVVLCCSSSILPASDCTIWAARANACRAWLSFLRD
jgi:hypothetical protein